VARAPYVDDPGLISKQEQKGQIADRRNPVCSVAGCEIPAVFGQRRDHDQVVVLVAYCAEHYSVASRFRGSAG
jgi:hypothetical protein